MQKGNCEGFVNHIPLWENMCLLIDPVMSTLRTYCMDAWISKNFLYGKNMHSNQTNTKVQVSLFVYVSASVWLSLVLVSQGCILPTSLVHFTNTNTNIESLKINQKLDLIETVGSIQNVLTDESSEYEDILPRTYDTYLTRFRSWLAVVSLY